MYEETNKSQLIINEVASQEIYDAMSEQGYLVSDELYLVPDSTEVGVYDPDPKTEEMTQPVGVDDNGKFWTAVSSSITFNQMEVTLAAASWVDNQVTLSIAEVTEASAIQCGPVFNGTNEKLWSAAGAYCASQGSGTLTFACATAPTDDIRVVLFIHN